MIMLQGYTVNHATFITCRHKIGHALAVSETLLDIVRYD